MPRRALLSFFLALVSHAATLTPTPNGLLVYDSANNVTWLADFNLPASNRFTVPPCVGAVPQPCINLSGSMQYPAAAQWVAAMNAANYLGHANWQIPTTPPVDKSCGKVGPNGNSFGFGCTLGAFASLYNALGFTAPNTAVPIPPSASGPFSNLQPYLYWSQTSQGGQGYSTFSFVNGFSGANTAPNFLYVLPMVPGKVTAAGTVYDAGANVTFLANANLAASNAFGLPPCQNPTTPALCIAVDGAMTWDSAAQFIVNMNAAAYLGQKNWQLPPIDPSCNGFLCTPGPANPLEDLYYNVLSLTRGVPAVAPPDVPTGPFHHLQPYLYWTCTGSTVAGPCSSDPPVPNQEWSFSFGSGFTGTDILPNELYVTAYFPGPPSAADNAALAAPVIAEVANAEAESPVIAPNTWIEIKGVNLSPPGDTRIWQQSDFVNGQLPTQLDKVAVTVNGKPAYVYYISPTQIDVLTPPDPSPAQVQVVVTNNGVFSTSFTAQSQPLSPSFFVVNGGPYIVAVHLNGALIDGASPAKPGETIVLFANGFGPQATLSPLPQVQIGSQAASVSYAGQIFAGEFQFNVTLPAKIADGDQVITATYNGAATQPGALITVHN